MGALTSPDLDDVLALGCNACASKKLTFLTYVEGALTLLGGEPVRAIAWVYDGEAFVDGIYEVRCGACENRVFRVDVCPRCHAAGGLERALGGENTFPVPEKCPTCAGEEVRYRVLLPAKVAYEGKRAAPARTTHELQDAGVHGTQVDCRACGVVSAVRDGCPLCGRAGAIRARPG